MSGPTVTRLLWTCMGVALIGAPGCGQKGNLYLPDHNGAVVTRPAGTAAGSGPQQPTTPPATSPGATKKDSNKDGDSGSQK